MPFSYAQYAGNGSATTFSVPFPYLLKGHVKLYTGYNILNGTFASQLVDGVGYTWTSGTQVQTTVAPAVGVALTIIRETPDSSQVVAWNDGSNLIADDQNTADLQNLYVVQEQQDRNDAGITLSQAAKTASETATSTANTALSSIAAAQATAASAVSTANAANATSASALSVANTKGDEAIATANAASTSATNAVSTANAANSSAAGAVTTANAATASAAGAVTTANAADVKADAAITAANAATTASNTATSTANSALSTASTALSNSSAAISTANTAASNASAAVSTANTASSDASAAASTANAASSTAGAAASNAAAAVSTANTAAAAAAAAVSTANTASSDATAAVSTANTASSNASAAVSTANTAASNASAAVTTANTASTNASSALSAANNAVTTANNATAFGVAANANALEAVAISNAATAAVASAVLYDTVANVAAIPASPSNGDAVEVTNSTGIESFSPLAGLPAGFVGSSALSVRLVYNATSTTWSWIQYYPNDPEDRYLAKIGGTMTGPLLGDNSTSASTPGFAFDGDPDTGLLRPGANELALVTGGTARLSIDSSGNVAVPGGLTRAGNNVVTLGDTGTVTSSMILDGTIVNTDISATAGIENSKLAASGVTAGSYGSSTQIPSLTVNDKGVITAASTNSLPAGIVTTSDAGTVTSTMITDGTIVDGDINASAAIVDTKLATIATAGKVSNSATTATNANTASAIVARDVSGNFSAGTITADLVGNASTVTTNANLTGDVTSVGNATSIAAGVIVDADINASAAIAHSKLANIPVGQVLLGNSSNLPTATALSGDLTVNGSGTATLANSGASAGTYRSVTVDAKGRVTSGTSPTTFSEYQLSDTSANLAAAITDKTGTGALVFANSPALTGTPTAPTAAAGTDTTQLATTAFVLANGGGFPSGTAMLFAQTSAPTGWTKSTTHNDKALRVVSGTASSGGTTAFTSVFASRTPSGTVGATTLTATQIPSHAHRISVNPRIGYTTFTGSVNQSYSVATGSSGSNPNGSDNTGGGGSHDHSFTANPMDFAVQYVDVIIATKN